MNVGLVVLGVLIIIGCIAKIIVDAFTGDTEKKKTPVIIGILIGVFMIVLSSSFTIIPTGYSGVRTTFGQVDNVTVQNGFNWKLPFIQDIELVNNKQQDVTFEGEIWSETSTRTAIFYDNITITYQINAEKSAWIYANVSDYKNSLVSKNILASAIKSSSKTLSDTDATNRSIIEPLVADELQKSLNEKYGENTIIVYKVVISNADFEDSYNEAIANKQKAQLEAEQQAIINQQNIDKAEADAKVALTKAQAEADAKLIAAQAEADSNALLEKSLTEMILQEMYINKWNGELPDVVGSENASLLYGLDTLNGTTTSVNSVNNTNNTNNENTSNDTNNNTTETSDN